MAVVPNPRTALTPTLLIVEEIIVGGKRAIGQGAEDDGIAFQRSERLLTL